MCALHFNLLTLTANFETRFQFQLLILSFDVREKEDMSFLD